MNKHLIPTLLLLIACNSSSENDVPVVVPAGTVTVTKQPIALPNSNPTFIESIQASSNAASLLKDGRWQAFESSADADTALVLFAYKVAKQPDATFEDFESYIRLYKESDKVQQLLPRIFRNDTTVQYVLQQLVFINQQFRLHAEIEVAANMKEYGESDGPYFDFVTSLKK